MEYTLEEIRAKAIEYGMSEAIADGIVAHVQHGRIVGGFLTAVLENDFHRATLTADPNNRALFREFTWLTYNYLPHGSHGSAKAVAKWRRAGGIEGGAQ